MTRDEIRDIAKAEATRWPPKHELSDPTNVSHTLTEAIRILSEAGYEIQKKELPDIPPEQQHDWFQPLESDGWSQCRRCRAHSWVAPLNEPCPRVGGN